MRGCIQDWTLRSRAGLHRVTAEVAGVGTFRVEATVGPLDDRARSVTLPLLVDTGASYTTLPREIAQGLGLEPIDVRRVQLADGREERWPIAAIHIRVGGQAGPSLALIGPPGGPALLGAVTLEELALGVDPLGQRLVPTISLA